MPRIASAIPCIPFSTIAPPPSAFSIFATAQSPRDTHAMYEDFWQTFRPLPKKAVHSKGCVSVPREASRLKELLRW
ncbi:hypothetical protein SCP_0208530 [Sparassis crispa]|uniref:Uncharacterized protein n=1 Tax=Sparassis crispa TaxID=139825 RepID=A0A401GBZ7_9APHY|nr:hypothetical protein SCP_0208530 [Sparassis crispa]GBE79653.1 hypothetical protein SCP_0208530 [Sparassis crispa]